MALETTVGLHGHDGTPQPQEQLPEAPPPPGPVSVLLCCVGQLEHTRLCLPRLLRHSAGPYELIALDAGSLDGTAAYLAGVADAARVPVEVVRASTDCELPAAVRQSLALARGDHLVLLNNDVLVTAGWLNQLAALAELAPEIALVGPMSNYAAPPQRVEAVPYRAGDPAAVGEALDAFAAAFRAEHRGRWLEVDELGGFCLLIKRAALEHLGPIPTATGLDIFDTQALCRRAREAGYRLACCGDLFVHHIGSRTFAHGGPVT
jgi:GT2 family glycosyltransferase